MLLDELIDFNMNTQNFLSTTILSLSYMQLILHNEKAIVIHL